MIQLREQYWAVEVADNGKSFEIGIDENRKPYLTYTMAQISNGFNSGDVAFMIELPPGTWEIVCTSKSVTEKQAAAIVERNDFGYFIYMNNYTCIATYYQTPKPSLRSLLTSKGCVLNKNYLILKKQ